MHAQRGLGREFGLIPLGFTYLSLTLPHIGSECSKSYSPPRDGFLTRTAFVYYATWTVPTHRATHVKKRAEVTQMHGSRFLVWSLAQVIIGLAPVSGGWGSLLHSVPTHARPFVYLHTVKTGGTTLREIIRSGATAGGVPDNQQFIPCHAGLDCSTSTLPHKNFSIIAGHFTWRELQRTDLQNFDCIVSVRRPADRVMSCLSFFYPRKIMESVQNMSRLEFSRLATEQTTCNNAMARMLVPAIDGIYNLDSIINNNALHAPLFQIITKAAVENLKKCFVVDLADDLHHNTPFLLAKRFPWMQPPQQLPRLRQRRLAYYKFQPSHIEQIEQLNALDNIIFAAALKEMQQQQRTTAP